MMHIKLWDLNTHPCLNSISSNVDANVDQDLWRRVTLRSKSIKKLFYFTENSSTIIGIRAWISNYIPLFQLLINTLTPTVVYLNHSLS